MAFDDPADLRAVVDAAGRDLAASDARACTGRFASLPAEARIESGTYRLDLQTACDASGSWWTVDYSFFGMPDGRLFRFSIVEAQDGQSAPPPADAPELSPAVFDAATARVISATAR